MTHAPAGFGPGGITFLNQLAITNTREFFTANRSTYEHQVAAPLRALVEEVGHTLRDTVSPGVDFDLRVGKSLFRINRDLRFSTEKTATTRGSTPSGGRDLTLAAPRRS